MLFSGPIGFPSKVIFCQSEGARVVLNYTRFGLLQLAAVGSRAHRAIYYDSRLFDMQITTVLRQGTRYLRLRPCNDAP